MDCGVSIGSEVDAEGVSVRAALMAGVVLILSRSARAGVSVVRGHEGSTVSMAVCVHGAGPEGRRGRLAACAPSAEGPS